LVLLGVALWLVASEREATSLTWGERIRALWTQSSAGNELSWPISHEGKAPSLAAEQAELDNPEPRVGAILGVVLDQDDKPIEGASLVLEEKGGLRRETLSDASGVFAFSLPEFTLCTLSVHAEGYTRRSYEELEPSEVPLQIRLEQGLSLNVQVLDEQGRAAQATCMLGMAGSFPAQTLQTDSRGRCVFSGLKHGYVDLVATAPGLSSDWTQTRFSAERSLVSLVLRPAEPFSVRAEGPDGEGLVRAMLSIAPDRVHTLAFRCLTDADGYCHFPAFPPGRFIATVRATGFVPDHGTVFDSPMQALLVLVPRAACSVSGRVVDEDLRPIEGARLRARVTTPRGELYYIDRDTFSRVHSAIRLAPVGLSTSSYFSSGDGSFLISGLPEGRVELEARVDGFAPSKRVELELSQGAYVGDVLLRCAAGRRLQLRVENTSGAALEGASVRWRPKGDDAWSWSERKTTNSAGLVELEALPPEVELELSAESFETLRSFDSTGAASRVLSLRPLEGELRGRVLGPRGPLAGVELRQQGVRNREHCQTKSDAKGRFVLRQCGDGEWILELEADELPPAWARVRSGEELELVMAQAATLELYSEYQFEMLANVEIEATVLSGTGTIAYSQSVFVGPGRTLIGALPAGRLRLSVEAPGHAPLELERTLAAGETELIELHAQASCSVDVWILDALGAPVAKACASVREGGCELQSDVQGRLRFEGLSAGEHSIFAVHALWGRALGSVSLEEGENMRLELRLEQPVDAGGWAVALGEAGVEVEQLDGAWVVAGCRDGAVWCELGLQRGDLLEAFDGSTLRLMRDQRRLTLRKR
jgi:hypothetical protein